MASDPPPMNADFAAPKVAVPHADRQAGVDSPRVINSAARLDGASQLAILHNQTTAPIILPPLRAAGFDLVWFGILMTIVMEMGLIHPPVGLNIFVIKNIAPDIPLKDVMWGVMPFVGLMFVAIVLICVFPGIAVWFPNAVMGSGR
jgi:TRAP-type C4-dicarboxylate transport system permease large subunit